MKRLSFLIALFLMFFNFVILESLNAQNTDTLIYQFVEDMPTFSTCDNAEDTDRKCTEAAVEAFIKANMEYPEFALKMGVEGSAVVSCIVEKDGSLSDFKVIRNPGAETGKEALRLIKSLPNFQPGKQRDEVLRVQMNFVVRFRITPEVKAKARARKKTEKARIKAERKKKD